ncbi:MAG TPA: Zn-dependent alcohol dehydrogenase [Pseudomonadales bacterium]|nr:Zn-dependent alcohol dehydrogenase [Pseudomonadales bacterium]HND13940.1 Zn-dependent alcohol dehydrogenase [Pseudomonadales bacterium]
MRAAVLEAPGQPLVIRDDVEIIAPRVGEVRVRVRYCGLCHSDYSMISGAFPLGEPIIVGHEAAGVVESVGPGVTHLAPGDPVVMTATPPCGRCYYCLRGQHSLCVDGIGIATMALPDGSTGLSRGGKRVLRGVGLGALAEYVITPANGAIKVPADVPLDVACVIGCAVQTGVGAVLNTARVEPGATVLIQGLGGIGLSTVQGTRIAGAARVIVSDPVAARRDAAIAMGATHAVDPLNEDLGARVMQLTDSIGVDYAFETAGVAALIESCLALTRKGGMTVCVGAPPFDQSVTIENVVMFASSAKRLCGCLLGSCNSLHEIPRLIALWRAGKLDLEGLITARRPLPEVNEGFADMAAGRGIRTVIEI